MTEADNPHSVTNGGSTNLATFLKSVIVGAVMALSLIPGWMAVAPLLFSGPLSPYTPICLGMLLLGSIVAGIYIPLRRNTRYAFAVCQVAESVPILATLLAHIAAAVPDGPSLVPTAVAAIAVSAVVVGIVFVLVGWLKLGGLIRFIPYAVLHGFLAGVGLFLVFFALSLATGSTVTISHLSPLWGKGALLKWGPAVAYGAALFFITNRWKNPLLLPGILVATVLLFLAAMQLTGIDSATAMARGWILGPFDENARLWPPLDLADLARVEWSVLLQQCGLFGLIALVYILDLLACSAGRVAAIQQEEDVNEALRVSGASNILSGVLGGYVGYEGLIGSTLSYKLGVPKPIPALTCAAITAAVMMFGASILSSVPKFMLGGLITFMALSIIVEPLFSNRRRMTLIEYVLVWGVALAVLFFGVAEGAACGVLVSLGIFVISYSRLNVIRFSGVGANIRSVVSRSPAAEQWLARAGEATHILRLQGYIFFGTADALVTQIREILDAGGARYLILDFARVDGIDAAGLASFTRLRKMNRDAGVTLVFSELAPEIRRRLELASDGTAAGLQGADNSLQTYADLDRALEWCEDRLLRGESDKLVEPLEQMEARDRALIRTLVADMTPFCERVEYPVGHVLWYAGDPSPDMYYVESGELQLFTSKSDVAGKRVAVVTAGDIIGVNGFYLQEARPATMRVTQPCVLQRVSDAAMQRLAQEAPALAVRLEHYLLVQQTRLLVRSFRSADKAT
ncbi:MAG: SulP family inorganic anion transporter [Planctomycetia bacterium]|nr:SulP family inorganic anion transporter [Planctomycetia bacterium]